jgi:hypothetical protein
MLPTRLGERRVAEPRALIMHALYVLRVLAA